MNKMSPNYKLLQERAEIIAELAAEKEENERYREALEGAYRYLKMSDPDHVMSDIVMFNRERVTLAELFEQALKEKP